jgi:hypothetical protein
LDVQSLCLFAFFKTLGQADRRAASLAHQEIVDAVFTNSTSMNAVLNGIAHAVIDAIMTFDRQSADKLKLLCFDAFDQE